MLKNIILVLFLSCTFQVQAALISNSGVLTETNNGYIEFSVDQPSSTVNLWEISENDFRITLFDANDLFVATNDDNNWGTNAGPEHAGQDFLDASLLLSLFEGNYTLIATHWLNESSTNIDAFGNNDGTGTFSMFVEGDGISADHVATVPAPPTLISIVMGLIGIGFFQKKNKQKQMSAMMPLAA